ncbi:MAG: hypothetical protein K0U36_06840 [Alphaproteobacteria bacterium]|nr:hypothetical protein [Alphaproteobacteria bacterium]
MQHETPPTKEQCTADLKRAYSTVLSYLDTLDQASMDNRATCGQTINAMLALERALD